MAPKVELPAVPEYPTEKRGGPFHELLETTKAHFLEVVDKGDDYWETQGERDGVSLSRHINPEDTWAVPAVRGTCLVEGATTDEVLAVIQLPGMRKKWDPRFDDGYMLARYDRLSYTFYTSMLGMGWLVYPRTIAGVQGNYRQLEQNQEIIIIQVSMPPDGPGYPGDESGMVRAKLNWGGWKLTPKGDDVEVAYGVDISLEGSIPTAMVAKIATEIPTCTGRVRDVFYEHGCAPYLTPPPGQTDIALVLQTEEFIFETYTWHSIMTGGNSASSFLIRYDQKRMYKDGVQVKIEGDGKDAVEAKDDGKGIVEVQVGESAKGKRFDVYLSRK